MLEVVEIEPGAEVAGVDGDEFAGRMWIVRSRSEDVEDRTARTQVRLIAMESSLGVVHDR